MPHLNKRHTANRAVYYQFIPVFFLAILTAVFTTGASAAELIINGNFESPELGDKTIFPPDSRPGRLGWATFFGQNYDPSNPAHPPCVSQCYNDTNGDLILIPGWSVVWTDTLVMEDPANPGEFITNPNPEPGRVELQSNLLPLKMFGIDAAALGNQKAELDSHDRKDINGGFDNCTNVSITQEFPVCPNTPYQLTYWWKSRTTIPGDNDVRVVADTTRVRIHMLTDSWQMETIDFVTDDSGWSNVAFVSIGDAETHGMSLDGVSIIGPNPLFEECPPPPGTCETCDDVEPGWVDPLTCEPCIPWEPEYTKSGKLKNGCGLCETKGSPDTLTMLYDGNDASAHAQDPDKASAVPEVVAYYPVTALIRVSNEKDGTILWEGSRKIGQTFEVVPENEMMVEIFEGPLLIQTIRFHASCSQPLEILDEFGGITIWNAVK